MRVALDGSDRPGYGSNLSKDQNLTSLLPSDLLSFQRQETIFIVLNLVLLALLLALHTVFASHWGHPSAALIVALATGFGLNLAELFWLRTLRQPLTPVTLKWLTYASVMLNLTLAALLAILTDNDDTPYSVLMVTPILIAAIRCPLSSLVAVIGFADFLNFFGLWRYFQRHPPAELGEYLEATILSLIFAITGLLVWVLVRQLKRNEEHLARNLQELQRTREKLLQEEKLAAVGRLSSAIAHEIRNPVAMISSSLETAKQLAGGEREEMFGIAAAEASRLVSMTTDFLAYARPLAAKLQSMPLDEIANYVADVCRAHAHAKGVRLEVETGKAVIAEIDPGLLDQAVVNLVMNAVDASPAGGVVCLRCRQNGDSAAIEVDNAGPAIPPSVTARIFEPFFTTKARGSGLGLAIARNIARAHRGELALALNGPQTVRFALSVPQSPEEPGKRKRN
jgi:signal transduction histidine kinase